MTENHLVNEFDEDTLTELPPITSRGKATIPHLFIAFECDRPTSGGARYSLADVDEVLFGRGDRRASFRTKQAGRNRLTITIPGRWMSKLHACISIKNGFLFRDLQSTNGSFVNGSRVESKHLEDGDLLELGHTVFLLRMGLPTPLHAPLDQDSSAPGALPTEFTSLHPDLAEALAILARVADSELPVILLGETGTGKERLARAIHRLSGRTGPILAVNCGALPSNLIESQLFGHVKGAFSGAIRDEPGFLRSAENGTLMLDEIGDLPCDAQASLLRVLEEREVVPVGSTRAIPINVRVLAATHRPLETMVGQKLFRADLLARLDGTRHHLPPLRARREDLGAIVAEILERSVTGRTLRLLPETARLIMSFDWQQNIRQLVNYLTRATTLCTDGVITPADLGVTETATVFAERRPQLTKSDALDEINVEPLQASQLRNQLLETLKRNRGNVSATARAMGKARMQIQRWVRRFNIDVLQFRQ